MRGEGRDLLVRTLTDPSDGHRSERFSHHVTSSAHVVDDKGNTFGRTIYPLSFAVKALKLLELRRCAKSAPLSSFCMAPKDHKSQVWIGLMHLRRATTLRISGIKF